MTREEIAKATADDMEARAVRDWPAEYALGYRTGLGTQKAPVSNISPITHDDAERARAAGKGDPRDAWGAGLEAGRREAERLYLLERDGGERSAQRLVAATVKRMAIAQAGCGRRTMVGACGDKWSDAGGAVSPRWLCNDCARERERCIAALIAGRAVQEATP